MIYNLEDEVYVVDAEGKQLHPNKMTIFGIDDNETYYMVTGLDANGEQITMHVNRDYIMHDYDTEKLVYWFVQEHAQLIDDLSEVDELDAYREGALNEHTTVYADATADGMAMFFNHIDNVVDMNKWLIETFNHYSYNNIYVCDHMYYTVLVS